MEEFKMIVALLNFRHVRRAIDQEAFHPVPGTPLS